MQIRHRLFFLYLGVTVLLVMMGVYTIISTNSTLKTLQSGGTQYLTVTQAANEVSSYAKRTEGHLMLYLTLNDQSDRDKFYTRHTALLEQLDILQTAVKDSSAKIHVDQMSVQAADLLLVGQSLLDAYDRDPKLNGYYNFQADAPDIRQLDTIAANIRQEGVDLANDEIRIQDTVIQKTIAQNRNVKISVITLLIIAIIVLNIMAFFHDRQYCKTT